MEILEKHIAHLSDMSTEIPNHIQQIMSKNLNFSSVDEMERSYQKIMVYREQVEDMQKEIKSLSIKIKCLNSKLEQDNM